MEETIKLQALDTAFVNLARLIRYLREREFSGRLHIALEQYDADIFLYPGAEPSVWEIDRATGREAQGPEALQRLLVRSQESGGLITIHKRAPEKIAVDELEDAVVETSDEVGEASTESQPQTDWDQLIAASSELISSTEKAVQTTGEDFAEHFHAARLELGDDYPFIDPTLGDFEYKPGGIRLRQHPTVTVYVNSIAAVLGQVVNRIAVGPESGRFRERVAAELAIAARKHPNALGDFTSHLDRIAGTRVL